MKEKPPARDTTLDILHFRSNGLLLRCPVKDLSSRPE